MFKPHPRTRNTFTLEGKSLVAKVPHFNGDYLPTSVSEAIRLLGGLGKAIQSGDRVMIKPNFNCSYATPLSTDLGFLEAVIQVLQDAGARVTVGEMSGKADGPTMPRPSTQWAPRTWSDQQNIDRRNDQHKSRDQAEIFIESDYTTF